MHTSVFKCFLLCQGHQRKIVDENNLTPEILAILKYKLLKFRYIFIHWRGEGASPSLYIYFSGIAKVLTNNLVYNMFNLNHN